VGYGFFDCTLCTSDVWVGGLAGIVVGLAVVCYMDNCCNFFIICSTGFVWDEPTIPLACGPTLSVWSYQVLIVAHLERYRTIN
jgi:hypothetical protein